MNTEGPRDFRSGIHVLIACYSSTVCLAVFWVLASAFLFLGTGPILLYSLPFVLAFILAGIICVGG